MAIAERKIEADLSTWLDDLYDLSKTTEDDLKLWYSSYQYQGFDRVEVLSTLRKLVPDRAEATQIILVCALRGPRRAAETKLLSGKTISSYQIPASGLKGSKGISCQRITAATADLAACYLKKLNVPKRLMVDCPAYLQFPAAGSILLPEDLRIQHIEFSRKFSQQIGGAFNEQIYSTMMANAYLDKRLNLFPEAIHLFSSASSTSSSAPSTAAKTASATPVVKGKP